MEVARLNKDHIIKSFQDFGERVHALAPNQERYEVIGKHIRHVIDHINAVLNRSGKVVDYHEYRNREHIMETSLNSFLFEYNIILGFLLDNEIDTDENLEVRDFMRGIDEKVETSSTVGRELKYGIYEHFTHHIDTMCSLLKEAGYEVDRNNALSESTRRA